MMDVLLLVVKYSYGNLGQPIRQNVKKRETSKRLLTIRSLYFGCSLNKPKAECLCFCLLPGILVCYQIALKFNCVHTKSFQGHNKITLTALQVFDSFQAQSVLCLHLFFFCQFLFSPLFNTLLYPVKWKGCPHSYSKTSQFTLTEAVLAIFLDYKKFFFAAWRGAKCNKSKFSNLARM